MCSCQRKRRYWSKYAAKIPTFILSYFNCLEENLSFSIKWNIFNEVFELFVCICHLIVSETYVIDLIPSPLTLFIVNAVEFAAYFYFDD